MQRDQAVSRVVLHEKVFCENGNRWVEDIDLDLRLSIEDEDKIHSSIKNDIGLITEIPGVYKYLSIIVFRWLVGSSSSKMSLEMVDYVLKNPRWKVSLQTHKYLNIP